MRKCFDCGYIDNDPNMFTCPQCGSSRIGDVEPRNPNMGRPNPNMGRPNPNMNRPNPNMGNPNMGRPNPGMNRPPMGRPNPNMGNPNMGNPNMGNPNMGNPNMGRPPMNNMPRNGMGNPNMGRPNPNMNRPNMNKQPNNGAPIMAVDEGMENNNPTPMQSYDNGNVVSFGEWLKLYLLLMIPFFNIYKIIKIVIGGPTINKSITNAYRAGLVFGVALSVIMFLLSFVFGALVVGAMM